MAAGLGSRIFGPFVTVPSLARKLDLHIARIPLLWRFLNQFVQVLTKRGMTVSFDPIVLDRYVPSFNGRADSAIGAGQSATVA